MAILQSLTAVSTDVSDDELAISAARGYSGPMRLCVDGYNVRLAVKLLQPKRPNEFFSISKSVRLAGSNLAQQLEFVVRELSRRCPMCLFQLRNCLILWAHSRLIQSPERRITWHLMCLGPATPVSLRQKESTKLPHCLSMPHAYINVKSSLIPKWIFIPEKKHHVVAMNIRGVYTINIIFLHLSSGVSFLAIHEY